MTASRRIEDLASAGEWVRFLRPTGTEHLFATLGILATHTSTATSRRAHMCLFAVLCSAASYISPSRPCNSLRSPGQSDLAAGRVAGFDVLLQRHDQDPLYIEIARIVGQWFPTAGFDQLAQRVRTTASASNRPGR